MIHVSEDITFLLSNLLFCYLVFSITHLQLVSFNNRNFAEQPVLICLPLIIPVDDLDCGIDRLAVVFISTYTVSAHNQLRSGLYCR